jgi:hypothetical protein
MAIKVLMIIAVRIEVFVAFQFFHVDLVQDNAKKLSADRAFVGQCRPDGSSRGHSHSITKMKASIAETNLRALTKAPSRCRRPLNVPQPRTLPNAQTR